MANLSAVYQGAITAIKNNFNNEIALYDNTLPSFDNTHIFFIPIDKVTNYMDAGGITGKPFICYDLDNISSDASVNYANSIFTLSLAICFRETTRDAYEKVVGYLLDYSQVLRNVFYKYYSEFGAVYFEDGAMQNPIDNNHLVYTLTLTIKFHYA